MADPFLQLQFARRLRSAEGLHPLAGEALTRRGSAVALGALLQHLPQHERKALGFFRRLFSRGGESARWQKTFGVQPDTPRLDLVLALVKSGDAPADATTGPVGTLCSGPVNGSMTRLAMALGVLAVDVLEDTLAPTNAAVAADARTDVERAQARLWIKRSLASVEAREREWKPLVDLGEADIMRAATQQLERALQTTFGAGPGESALLRWQRALSSEMAPAVDAKHQGLPHALAMDDGQAEGPHFESARFVEQMQRALSRFVHIANRLCERLVEQGDRDALADAICGGGKSMVQGEAGNAEIEAARPRWREWVKDARLLALQRGRNPKPAFLESSAPSGRPTMALSTSDLPEGLAPGAPPLPDLSGPVSARAPAFTQEVSVAQIEAEMARATVPPSAAPAHTQEVSLADIQAAAAAAGGEVYARQIAANPASIVPAMTQEVSLAQIEDARVAALAAAMPADAAPEATTTTESPADPPRE